MFRSWASKRLHIHTYRSERIHELRAVLLAAVMLAAQGEGEIQLLLCETTEVLSQSV